MRIIAGEYKGRVIKSLSGNKTRPTSDRLRETLFNVIAPRIGDETRFLDLCSGTGAIGIEAISRGCSFACFVDISRKACALIEENLDALEIPEAETDVVCEAAESFVSRPAKMPWDIVFFDPPYADDHLPVLREFADSSAAKLNTDGLLIVEHHSKTRLPDGLGDLRRWRILKQGESSLSFYEYN
jgi:16S rRNA (guanine(966)-N(2))-methyltransferase RsmD